MNETFNIQGVILKRDDFRETDSRVLVYSQERGLINLVARGTKKNKSKLAAHLEPMSLVEIMMIRGNTYDYVGSARARDCFYNLKNDYNKILEAGAVLRRLSEVIKEHEIDENIFFLLVNFLDSLNFIRVTIHERGLWSAFFMFKLMSFLGYQPILDSCAYCHSVNLTKQVFFNYKKGVLECDNCQKISTDLGDDFRPLSMEAVIWLRKIIESDFKVIFSFDIGDNLQKELLVAIRSFEKYHLI